MLSAGALTGSRVSSSVLLRPRWGSSEGGLDRLGWVRALLRHIEDFPLEAEPKTDSDGSGQEPKALKRKWSFTFNKVGHPYELRAALMPFFRVCTFRLPRPPNALVEWLLRPLPRLFSRWIACPGGKRWSRWARG